MKDRNEIEQHVERQLAATLPAVDLLEVSTSGSGDGAMLKVVIDHSEGVTHDLCAAVTHRLEEVGLRDEFGIEVWSPGPERPLRTSDHFAAAAGHEIALWRAGGPRRPQRARIVSVAGDQIGLEVSGEPLTIARGEIRRAHLVPEDNA